jgi:hypothetical protein
MKYMRGAASSDDHIAKPRSSPQNVDFAIEHFAQDTVSRPLVANEYIWSPRNTKTMPIREGGKFDFTRAALRGAYCSGLKIARLHL